jgi:hypothetical protein
MASAERPTVLLRNGVFAAEHVVTVNFGIRGEYNRIWFPLFAGPEPAERFLLSLGDKGKGMTVFQLASTDALKTLLAELKFLGTTHVNFTAEASSPDPLPIRRSRLATR